MGVLKTSSFYYSLFPRFSSCIDDYLSLIPWESPLSKLPWVQMAGKTEAVADALNAQEEVAALSSPVSTIDLWITESPLREETAIMVNTPVQAISASITPAPTLSFKPTKAPTLTPAPTAGEPILQPTALSNTYRPQPGSPIYLHIDKSGESGGSCDALYLVGQVFNDQSLPQVGLTIICEGEVAAKLINGKLKPAVLLNMDPAAMRSCLQINPLNRKTRSLCKWSIKKVCRCRRKFLLIPIHHVRRT
jgi:hypothetical protein